MIERGFADLMVTLHQIEAPATLRGDNTISNAVNRITPKLASSYQVVRQIFLQNGFEDITPFSDSDSQAGVEVHETPFNSMFIGVLRRMHEQFLDANALLAARAHIAAKHLDAESLVQEVNHMRVVGDAWTAIEAIFNDEKVLTDLHIIDPHMPEGRSGRRDTIPTSWELTGASFVQQAQDAVRDEILSKQSELLGLAKDVKMEAVMDYYNAHKTIGPILRSLRAKWNLKEEELAQRVGCSPSAVSAYERDAQTPSTTMLHAILNVLGVKDTSALGIAISMKYVFSAQTRK